MASAALLREGEAFKSHKSLISAFHRIFVKAGRIAPAYGRTLNQLFELRGIGDYGDTQHINGEEAEYAVNIAGEFIAAVRELWVG